MFFKKEKDTLRGVKYPLLYGDAQVSTGLLRLELRAEELVGLFKKREIKINANNTELAAA